MKNNSLNDIVKCDIEISSPASNDATFDSILLVVEAPKKAGKKTLEGVVSISTAEDLVEYGYTSTESAYVAANIAFSQNPAPGELKVCVRAKLESSTFEDLDGVLTRANSLAKFYGIHLTSFKDPKDVQAAVAWAEANGKLYGFEYTNINSCPVKNFNYFRSFGIYSGKADGYPTGEQPVENEYAALAWMAKCFGYEPGSESWALKQLSVIVPSLLSNDEKNSTDNLPVSSFRRYAGSNVTFGGKVLAGEWIDVIRFRDWLQNEMQTNVFNVLKANKKVPFTDAGIGLVEGQIEATLLKGQDVGGVSPTVYDADGNEIPGYTVYVPTAASLSEAQKKSRVLPGCRYTARLAGAIHIVEIHGNLTF